jgi:hypothetical protein
VQTTAPTRVIAPYAAYRYLLATEIVGPTLSLVSSSFDHTERNNVQAEEVVKVQAGIFLAPNTTSTNDTAYRVPPMRLTITLPAHGGLSVIFSRLGFLGANILTGVPLHTSGEHINLINTSNSVLNVLVFELPPMVLLLPANASVTGPCLNNALTFQAEFLVQHRIPGSKMDINALLRVGEGGAGNTITHNNSLRLSVVEPNSFAVNETMKNLTHMAYTLQHYSWYISSTQQHLSLIYTILFFPEGYTPDQHLRLEFDIFNGSIISVDTEVYYWGNKLSSSNPLWFESATGIGIVTNEKNASDSNLDTVRYPVGRVYNAGDGEINWENTTQVGNSVFVTDHMAILETTVWHTEGLSMFYTMSQDPVLDRSDAAPVYEHSKLGDKALTSGLHSELDRLGCLPPTGSPTRTPSRYS